MSSLVQPAAVVALANVRLRDASEALSRKLNATTVNVKTGGSRAASRAAASARPSGACSGSLTRPPG